MTISQKAQEHPLVVWSTVIIGAFLAGLTCYHLVLEYTHLEVITKANLEQLEKDSLELANQKQLAKDALSPPFTPRMPQRENQKASPPTLQQSPPDSNSSKTCQDLDGASEGTSLNLSAGSPLPSALNAIAPGMRISTATSAFPGGEIHGNNYVVHLNSGPFSTIAFATRSSADPDPRIDYIGLFFCGEASRRIALSEAVRVFASLPNHSEMLGNRIVWEFPNAYEVYIDQTAYSIQKTN